MAKYYYTTVEEPNPVYHTNQNCEEGKKIEPEKRVDTNLAPLGRTRCEVCIWPDEASIGRSEVTAGAEHPTHCL
jgi:hypothetical protein